MTGIHDVAIVEYVAAYWRENWTSPSVREIARHLGLASPSPAFVHLEGLVRRGVLERKRVSSYRVLYRPSERFHVEREAA